jgi:hypothetical protein
MRSSEPAMSPSSISDMREYPAMSTVLEHLVTLSLQPKITQGSMQYQIGTRAAHTPNLWRPAMNLISVHEVAAATLPCCGILLSLLSTQPGAAHDSKRPELDSWYKGLKNPNLRSAVVRDLGCCSAKDCHETDAEIRNGRWWARVGKLHTKYLGPKPASEAQHAFDLVYEEISWELTEWKEVPNEAILKIPNPTGSPVICHSTRNEIWCFIPDNQY